MRIRLRDISFLLLILAPGLRAEDRASGSTLEIAPDIIVKGRRPGDPVAEMPGHELAPGSSPSGNLAEVLRQDPAIAVREVGGRGAHWVSIRGEAPNQTRVFIEGVPLTDSAYQRSPLELISAEFLDRVRVYPTAVPVRLLDDGYGGAIELSRQPAADSAWKAGVRGGSLGFLRGNVAAPLGTDGALFAEAMRSQENFRYYNDNGTLYQTADDAVAVREHNGYWRATLFPWKEWNTSRISRLKAFSLLSAGETDLPGSTQSPQYLSLSQWYALAGLSEERRIGERARLRTSLYGRWQREDFRGDLPASLWIPQSTTGLTLGLRSAAEGRLGENGEWGLASGLHYEVFSPELTGLSPSRQRKLQLPVGLSFQWRVARPVTLTPSLLAHAHFFNADADPRFQTTTSGSGVRDRALFLLSPRLGTQWEESGFGGVHRLHLSGGRYQRVPSLLELYGTAWGLSPNPELEAEQAWKAEMEWSSRWKWVQWQYAVFVSYSENLIAVVANSPQTRMAVNVGEAVILGNEAALTLKSSPGFFGRGSMSLLRTRNLTPSLSQYQKELPSRPSRLRAEAGWDNGWLSAGYAIDWAASHYVDLSNSTQMGATSEHSLQAGLRPRGWGSFSIEIKNLWDELSVPAQVGPNAVTEVASQWSGYPAPGRRFYISWRYQI